MIDAMNVIQTDKTFCSSGYEHQALALEETKVQSSSAENTRCQDIDALEAGTRPDKDTKLGTHDTFDMVGSTKDMGHNNVSKLELTKTAHVPGQNPRPDMQVLPYELTYPSYHQNG